MDSYCVQKYPDQVKGAHRYLSTQLFVYSVVHLFNNC